MSQRQHGFQQPTDPHQFTAGIVYAVAAAGFYIFSAPLLQSGVIRVCLQSIYAVVAAATLGFNIATTLLDPADFGAPPQDKPSGVCFTCLLCQKQVQKRSKHCKRCNKCVDDFDHHCEWLNHCIGKRNYRRFFALLCSTLCMLSLHLAVNVYLLATSYLQQAAMQPRQHAAYGGHISLDAFRVVWCVYIALLAPLTFLVLELLAFHIILFFKGMSTYDYILAQRAAAEARPTLSSPNGSPLSCPCRGNSRVLPAGAGLDELPKPRAQQPSIRVDPCAALRMSRRPQRDTAQRAKHSSMAEYMFMPQPLPSTPGQGDLPAGSLASVMIEPKQERTEH